MALECTKPAVVGVEATVPGFIPSCQPSRVARPPSGPLWVHEIKHDGYRLMVRRDGARVRCFTRGGHDWADRFPAVVDHLIQRKATNGPPARRDRRLSRSCTGDHPAMSEPAKPARRAY